MKGIMLAALTLATVFATPAPASTDVRALEGPFGSELRSDEVSITGDASLELNGGELVSFGAFEGSFFAASLTLIAYEDEQTTIHAGGTQFTHHRYAEPVATNLRDATVTFRGDDDGILYVGGGDASLRVPLGAVEDETLFASPSGWFVQNGAIGRQETGPLVGFKHDARGQLPTQSHGAGHSLVPTSIIKVDFSFPELAFERVEVAGRPTFSLDNATILIEHSGGVLELHADRRGQDIVAVDRGTVIGYSMSAPEGAGEIAFERAGVALISPEPLVRLNGTARFPVADGRLTLDGRSHTVRGSSLEIEGDLAFVLTPGEAALSGGPTLVSHGVGSAEGARIADVPLSKVMPIDRADATTLAQILLAGAVVAWLLLSKASVALFIRDPYANPRRAAIVAALRAAGFRHLRGLQRDTALPLATLSYHLGILRRTGAVRAIRCDNRDVYFLGQSDLSPADAAALCVLASEATARVADALARGGIATQEELAARLSLDRSSVSRHVRRLVRSGLARALSGGEARYHALPLLERWVRTRRDPRSR